MTTTAATWCSWARTSTAPGCGGPNRPHPQRRPRRARRGRTVRRGEAPAFTTEQDSLFLVPPGAWWSLAWWLEHEEVVLYVNIQTPAVWDGDRLTTVDIDLDVIRFTDG